LKIPRLVNIRLFVPFLRPRCEAQRGLREGGGTGTARSSSFNQLLLHLTSLESEWTRERMMSPAKLNEEVEFYMSSVGLFSIGGRSESKRSTQQKTAEPFHVLSGKVKPAIPLSDTFCGTIAWHTSSSLEESYVQERASQRKTPSQDQATRRTHLRRSFLPATRH
jgi:hypothetical protein